MNSRRVTITWSVVTRRYSCLEMKIMGYSINAFSCERDGKIIRGREFLPEGDMLAPVIICHGFTSNYHSVHGYAEEFAGWGYAVYIFDFCGGGVRCTSDGRTQDMTVFTEVEDLKTVMDYVCRRPHIDFDRLILMGCSQGGFVAAIAAAQLPERVDRLVLLYPAFCIPDDARRGKMLEAQFDPRHIPEVMDCGVMPIGREYAASMLEADACRIVENYHGPVLIVHGQEDPVVDIAYSRKAFWHYQHTAGGSSRRLLPYIQLMEIQGAGHGFTGDHKLTAIFGIQQFVKGFTEVLNIDVTLLGRRMIRNGFETKVALPFEGKAQSPYFEGSILPGASDTKEWGGTQQVKRCENYILDGIDYTGTRCQIQVKNTSQGRKQAARFRTDSPALSFLNEGEQITRQDKRPQGPVIRVYARVPAFSKTPYCSQ